MHRACLHPDTRMGLCSVALVCLAAATLSHAALFDVSPRQLEQRWILLLVAAPAILVGQLTPPASQMVAPLTPEAFAQAKSS